MRPQRIKLLMINTTLQKSRMLLILYKKLPGMQYQLSHLDTVIERFIISIFKLKTLSTASRQ